jgi:hypothetical protein
MKKLLFLAILIAYTAFTAQAQDTLLYVNFSNGIPNTWKEINGNNAVPDPSFNGFFSQAWVADNGQGFGMGDCAVSTSYFTPVGVADNWMITAPVVIPAGSTNVGLYWQAAAVDAGYPDGYNLMISTHGSDTITGFTTTLYSIANENDYPDYGWTDRFIDLTSYAGDTISLAWVNNSNNMFVLGVTNISIVTSIPNSGVTLSTLDAYNYMKTGTAYQLEFTAQNNGFNPITSLTVNYGVNGGALVTGQLTGLNIAPGSSTTFYGPTTFTPAQDTLNHIALWTTTINGSTLASTDTLSRNIWSISNAVTKKVLLEEFTGAWCGFCPYGTVEIDTIMTNYPYVIPVAVHDDAGTAGADLMVAPEGPAIDSAYDQGDPTALIDRVFYLDQPAVAIGDASGNAWDFLWETYVQTRDAMESPANVSLLNTSYDSTSRLITSTVRADFLANVGGDYRLNLYVVEDSVVGSGTGYDQHNYFSNATQGGSVDPQSPLAALSDPIVGWYHRHVLRKAAGGAYGDSGIITPIVGPGSSFTKTYTYTLPAGYNANQITLVGIVQEYTADRKYRYVLNAEDAPLIQTATAIAPVSNSNFENVSLYPNPANNLLTVQFGLIQNGGVAAYVTDMVGQRMGEIYNGELNTGTHTLTLNASSYAAGVYFVTLKTADSEITQRFVVTK